MQHIFSAVNEAAWLIPTRAQVLIYMIADASGGHINPAVSVGEMAASCCS
jgi:glycerol uptake facilitator-like aquaporin